LVTHELRPHFDEQQCDLANEIEILETTGTARPMLTRATNFFFWAYGGVLRDGEKELRFLLSSLLA